MLDCRKTLRAFSNTNVTSTLHIGSSYVSIQSKWAAVGRCAAIAALMMRAMMSVRVAMHCDTQWAGVVLCAMKSVRVAMHWDTQWAGVGRCAMMSVRVSECQSCDVLGYT